MSNPESRPLPGIRDGAAALPCVLVLMATYNGAAVIEQQLQSILSQTGVRVRVAIGDDGSSDQTLALAQAMATANAAALTILRHDPPKRSASQNFFALLAAIDTSDADFMAFSDQDDIWEPDHLARAIGELDRTGAEFYSCNTLAFWPDGRTKALRKDFPERRFDHLFETASQGCTYVFRAAGGRRFADFVRGAGPALKAVEFHDWLLYAWARTHGHAWTMDPAHRVRYRQTRANVIGANSGLGAARRRLAMLRSGWLRTQSLRIIAALGLDDNPVHRRLERFRWQDRLWLAMHARQCRRRPRDAGVFAVMLILFGI